MIDKNLNVWYDREADFLEFRVGKPVKGMFRPIGDECFERINESTGEIIGVGIFHFSKRFPNHRELSLPIEVSLKTASPLHAEIKN